MKIRAEKKGIFLKPFKIGLANKNGFANLSPIPEPAKEKIPEKLHNSSCPRILSI